jgi:hypothetical protein
MLSMKAIAVLGLLSSAMPLNRATFFELISLYRSHDPQNITRANRILDSLLPKTATVEVDPEDKFAHAASVTFYRLFATQLPAPLRERAGWDVSSRVRAIEQHWYPLHKTNFHMGHTNFAMLFLEAFVLGSEAVGNSETRQKAYSAFHDFCDYTLHNGLTEFNATDYLRFDLHAMSTLATASTDPEVRRRARAFADFWWFDAALHYWPSGDRLTGANARTYNYVAGVGGAVALMRPFFTGAPKPVAGEGGWVALFDYAPPQYICEIAKEKRPNVFRGLWLAPEVDEFRKGSEGADDFERRAHGEFGHQYGKDRYTFFDPAYALGTGGSHYSSQERMLVADIASSKPLASISSQINPRAQTGSASVQDRNIAMILYSPMLPDSKKSVPIVSPVLLLPANADRILVNGEQADRNPGIHQIAAGDLLYLQEGNVYACLRFVEANKGFAGYQPTYHYRLDGHDEVGSLACVLYDGAAKRLPERNVHSGFIVEMATAKEFPTFAEFRKHIETQTVIAQTDVESQWTVRYRSGNREIALKKDLSKDLILDKSVNGNRVETPVHESAFSNLTGGILTIHWKGATYTIDLRRLDQQASDRPPA